MDVPAAVRDPRVYVNDDRTVLVRMWASGEIEVARREFPGDIWGAPQVLKEEK